jgi:hypothetical protein
MRELAHSSIGKELEDISGKLPFQSLVGTFRRGNLEGAAVILTERPPMLRVAFPDNSLSRGRLSISRSQLALADLVSGYRVAIA